MLSSTLNTTNSQAATILPDHAFENTLKLADRLYIAIAKYNSEMDKELSDCEKKSALQHNSNAQKQIYFFRTNLDAFKSRSDKLFEKIEIARASYQNSRLTFEQIEERLAMAREGTQIDELQTKILRLIRRKGRLEQQWKETKNKFL